MPIPAKKDHAAPKTARERVYTELKLWIVDGTLQPEEKISDQELAEYFSVSRTPIREAMQLLADQKLINIYPGKESRVAPIDFEQARQAYQIMAQLYALALEFAFPHVTADTAAELRRINGEFGQCLGRHDCAGAHQLDKQFHGIFLRIAPNEFLSNFIDVLDCHVERIERLYYSSDLMRKDSVSQHEAIISALEQGSLETAIRMTKENWLDTLKIISREDAGPA